MTLHPRFLKTLALLLPLLLAGCQTTMQRIADCKAGDWNMIGHKDGVAGENQNFAERKDFCADYETDKAKADSAGNYLAGWVQGNWDFWSGRGVADGRLALPIGQFEARLASDEVRKNNTPLNRPAYESGWNIGNGEYWNGLGKRDGTAGLPLGSQTDNARHLAQGKQIRFDEASYVSGWQSGNRTFWQDAGFSDARNGLPDSEFKGRAAKARGAGVQVLEDAYRGAWNAELVNYWRNLGTQDAVSGKEFGMRRAEAKQKGLKILESDYRAAWEERLAVYWRQAGTDDGYGKPFQLEERIANAARDGVFVIGRSRALYTEAWDAQNARYCTVENAFEFGRANSGMAVEVCQGPLRDRLKHAYASGQDYNNAAARHARAASDANELNGRLDDLQRQLGRLEREIRSELERKDRVVNDDTKRQDRRRELDRRDLIDAINRTDRMAVDAGRQADRLEREMQRLRRDIFLN